MHLVLFVKFLGDVNGDGIDDVLVGAPDHDQTGDNAGAAYLMYVSEL